MPLPNLSTVSLYKPEELTLFWVFVEILAWEVDQDTSTPLVKVLLQPLRAQGPATPTKEGKG